MNKFTAVFGRMAVLFAFSAFCFCEVFAFDLFFALNGYECIMIGVNASW
jgi:hypothetical protein